MSLTEGRPWSIYACDGCNNPKLDLGRWDLGLGTWDLGESCLFGCTERVRIKLIST